MKKSIAVFLFLVCTFAALAGDVTDYVTIGDKTYFSDDVKIGLNSIRISTDNGTSIKAPLKKVDAYLVNGRFCERLPVICPNGEVKCTALMELIGQRNGLRLYKYHSSVGSPDCCFLDKSKKESMLFIFKNGDLHLRVNKRNAETVFAFFGVKYLPEE
jgi:hypothetical protein